MTDNNRTTEERIQALEAEIARLRAPSAPRPTAPRVLEGQGPLLIDAAGNRILSPAEPTSTTVGGGGFGATRPDGRYMPDGVERDSRTGEVLRHVAHPGRSVPAGPSRTAQHQQAIDILDRAFPLQPHPVPDTGEA
jgi:hypothetical protein